jgi:hypothetical protein
LHVSCACRGDRKTAGGYIWKYKTKWFWLFVKMCYYDGGIRIPFYVTPSQRAWFHMYQIDNYSDTTSEFLIAQKNTLWVHNQLYYNICKNNSL